MNSQTSVPVVVLALLAGCAGVSQSGPQPVVPSVQAPAANSPAVAPANGAVFVGCGYLVVVNEGPTHFTVLIKGNDVKQARKGESLFVVDGVLIETADAMAKEIGAPSARGLPLLKGYMKWESDYTSTQNHWPPLELDGQPAPLPGIDAFMWMYEAPRPLRVLGQEVRRVAYLAAAVDGVVFVASAPARAEDDMHAVFATLGRVVRTLRRSPTPIDVLELSARLKGSKAPWQGCSVGG